jgi:hypothetical protein
LPLVGSNIILSGPEIPLKRNYFLIYQLNKKDKANKKPEANQLNAIILVFACKRN